MEQPEIEYRNVIPDIDSFFNIFESTGWNIRYKKTKESLYSAIIDSWFAISAYINDDLVGFGRVISDGSLHAFIVDLIIIPQYQGKGIGKAILEKLVAEIKNNGIRDIQLCCAKGKKEFYIKCGFTERPEDAPGMQYYNVSEANL